VDVAVKAGWTSERLLIVGMDTRGQGGGAARDSTDAWAPADALQGLVQKAYRLAQERDSAFIALAVPNDQVSVFVSALAGRVHLFPSGVWSTFEVGGADSVDQVVEMLPKKPRQYWRRDADRFRDGRLTLSTVDWTSDLSREGSSLVANVVRRNGTNEHPMLIERRLERWRRMTKGEHIGFLVSDHSETIAVCFARRTRDRVDAYEVGLVDGHPYRHAAYIASIIRGPVTMAAREHLPTVDLGIGHPYPKRVRGAKQVLLWDVVSYDFGGAMPTQLHVERSRNTGDSTHSAVL
jgi:hypothetical protein